MKSKPKSCSCQQCRAMSKKWQRIKEERRFRRLMAQRMRAPEVADVYPAPHGGYLA